MDVNGTFSCVLMHLMTFVCPFQVSDNVRSLFFKRKERAGLMVYSTNKREGKSVQHFTVKRLHCLGKTVAVRHFLDLLHTREKATLHLDLLCIHWSCYWCTSFCREAKCCCLMSPTMWQWWEKRPLLPDTGLAKLQHPPTLCGILFTYLFFLIGQIKPFPLPTKEENYLLIHHGTSFKTVWTAIAAPHTSVHLHGLPLQRHHVWVFFVCFL